MTDQPIQEPAEDPAATPTPETTGETPTRAEDPATTAAAPAATAAAATPAPRPVVPTPAQLARQVRPGPPRRPAASGRDVAERPAAGSPATSAPVAVPAPQPSTQELAERARQWGRVDEDGTVYVRTADGERPVGSYPGSTPDEALAYFARKYDELVAQLDLADQRLAVADASVKDVARALDTLRPTLAEAAAVGDLDALGARMTALDERVAQRRAEAERRRAKAKEAARAKRLTLVEEAETIAATDPERMQWKPAGERLRSLFDQWKHAQQSGQRLDKPVEEELWKRFSHARTTFDRLRRHHFAELEKRHGEVKALKSTIVAEAEALSTSRDWGATSAAYRALMDRWKSAGRAARKDDDVLWARFRAAQDQFFEARNADQAQVDEEFRANLAVKEALLAEAEALLPVKNLDHAKAALRGIQERWEAAGKVPRADLARVEKRMRAIETSVRQAEDDRWRRSNPETRARAEGALGQLEESIAGLEADLAKARDRGDERAVREAEQALTARRAWLEQIRQAADDFSA